MRKRLVAVVLTTVLCSPFIGCDSADTPAPTPGSDADVTTGGDSSGGGGDATACTSDEDCAGEDVGACQASVCTAGACEVVDAADGSTCDDGDACTTGDVCAAGACGGEAVVCDNPGACEGDGTCDAATGECTYDAKDCDDGDACTDDSCDPASGECANAAKDCDDGDACTDDSCDAETGECANAGKDCDDGDACTDDSCDAETGECANAAVDCDDADECTTDSCDAETGDCVNEVIPECQCTPACDGKVCGDDGCGGTCGDCLDGEECSDDGLCVAICAPDCDGKTCGDDGCGGSCGTCDTGLVCEDGSCVLGCTPDCTDKVCGDDGCGGSCGECADGESCVAGACSAGCEADCTGKVCGDDGCGGSCGECTGDGEVCSEDGTACEVPCAPACDGLECGDDGCGGSCGTCADADATCVEGLCVTECTPDCTDKTCGDDGCGGSCGECGDGESCVEGACVVECVPACDGLACGDDGCGGSCGECGAGSSCVDGECVVDCTPVCDGLECGDDGCGGSCGECADGADCQEGVCVLPAPVECGDIAACADACDVPWSADCLTGCSAGADEDTVLLAEAVSACILTFCGPSTTDSGCVQASCVTVLPACLDQCLPYCGANDCGDDGCGGSCGDCLDGDICLEGTCTDPSAIGGDTCDTGIPVALDDTAAYPLTLSADTTGLANDYDTGTGCPGGPTSTPYGAAGEDQVFALTVGVTGVYSFAATAPSGIDATMIIVADCADIESTCFDYANVYSSGPDIVEAKLTAGESYFLIVDSWGASGTGPEIFDIVVDAPCIPSCDGKECGADGCGATCGECEEGFACNTDTVCEDLSTIAGNACDQPAIVEFPESGPFVFSGDTSAFTGDFEAPTGEVCAGFFGGGSASNDMVFELTPTEDAVYTMTLVGAFDSAIYVTTDCGVIDDTTCLGGADFGTGTPEVVTATLSAGEPAYIIVDGYSSLSNLSGSFTLTIDEPCFPDCEGKECGGDGCGGTCGACEEGDACDVDQSCVGADDALGNTCANGIQVLLGEDTEYPVLLNANTGGGLTNDYSTGTGCPGGPSSAYGAASEDQVFEITVDIDGVYLISGLAPSGTDATMILVTDCEDVETTCLGYVNVFSTGPDTVQAFMEAGTSYFLIIDSWGASGTGPEVFPIEISEPCIPSCDGFECGDDGCGTSCGECTDEGTFCGPEQLCESEDDVTGNTCSEPFEILGPGTVTGDTTLFSNTFSMPNGACGATGSGGGANNDNVWQFTPEDSGVYTLTLVGDSHPTALYVTTDCEAIDETTCVGGGLQFTDGVANTVLVTLESGETYFIIVDGASDFSATNVGTYSLTIDPPCVPVCDEGGFECGPDGCGLECGTCEEGFACSEEQLCEDASTVLGNTCANGVVVTLGSETEYPLTIEADTEGLTNDYTTGIGCPGGPGSPYGVNGEDQVFELVVEETAVYEFAATASGDDATLIIVQDCEDIDSTCLDYVNVFSTGPDNVSALLEAGEPYFLIVDSWNTSTGPEDFPIVVEEPCIPSCEGFECGDDGCGTSCGACDEGSYCGPGQLCFLEDEVEGNTCSDPFAFPSEGGVVTGSTADASNNSSLDFGVCEGAGSSGGGGNPDEVYAFTPAEGGSYTVELDATFAAALSVSTSCDDVASTCIGGSASSTVGLDTVDINVTAGETYYVIIDGYSNFSATDSGDYTLSITQNCVASCEGKTCGSDGCGGICGFCGPGFACTADQVCESGDTLEGNTCASAFDAGAAPATLTGDTSDAQPTYDLKGGECDAPGPVGLEAPDEVWAFTAADEASYTFTLEAEWNAIAYVLTDCSNMATGCEAAAAVFDGSATYVRTMAAGETLYFVVDGLEAGDSGAYTVSVSAPCTPDCTDKECGDDGCGGDCGACTDGLVCDNGINTCIDPETCLDSCGGPSNTGQCYCDSSCFGFGDCCEDVCDQCDATFPEECGTTCVPDCAGKICGDDGCGGECGLCDIGLVCSPDGTTCDPDMP